MAEEAKPLERPLFKGEILLCEDNQINQHIVKSHLIRSGFDVVIANNGKESIDIVSGRMKNGERPFGMIFMDIYMPVMDGLKAADTLIRINSRTPVVALAANTGPDDIKTYGAHGMTDFLHKPFTLEELWSCLCRYFTPLGYEKVEEDDLRDEEEKKRRRLHTNFVKRNQTTSGDINAAIESGDIKLAHRLAHTLKGLAGLMGRNSLQEAARIVECACMDGSMEHIKEQMSVLEHELNIVLDELSPLLLEKKPQSEIVTFDRDKADKVFEKLEPLLLADSTMCLGLVDELRRIPKTDILISQIEDYEFETALETLYHLKKSLEAGYKVE